MNRPNHFAFRSIEQAFEKVSIAAPPDWVTNRPVDAGFQPVERGHLTILLLDDQYHAEKRQHYRRLVQRLETVLAVQDSSQWRLNFDPNTQRVVIHSIRVFRGDNCVEQASMERFRCLQRETSLEAFVIHGWVTLLLLLEDVRVGDIIDTSYTITAVPKLLPERFTLFHTLPLGVPIRALHLQVCFAQRRAMQWKSSVKELSPEIWQSGEEIRWEWRRENLMEILPQANLPRWFLASNWIEVTDCQSWNDVSMACVRSWPLDNPPAEVLEAAQTIGSDAATDEERFEKAVAFVQDGFRYLSVDDDAFGGGMPSPPGEVLRRRFGDCKDLSCLMVVLLRALGVAARPVLVNAMMGKKLQDFLPIPGVFNHVVVEYEIGSERRWVDPTRRLQGGGYGNRPVEDFGIGLLIDSTVKDLQLMPDQPRNHGYVKLKETFLLNTAGPSSILQVNETATGAQADAMRNAFANEPERTIAEQREQFYAQMFPQVRRLGRIEHNDSRVANEFVLSEMYEISGALRPSSRAGLCVFTYASHPVQRVLRLPLNEERRHPCAVVHPYQVEHVIEVEMSRLQFEMMPRYSKSHPVFRMERESRCTYGLHTITYSFQTLSDTIFPNQFGVMRKVIEELWVETVLRFHLPVGVQGRKPKPPCRKR